MMNKTKIIIALSTAMLSTAFATSCSTNLHSESTGEYLDSSMITTRVKAKLLADDKVSGLPITVKTYKNVVLLSGFVNSNYQKQRAEELARSVKGVVYVEDSLIVKYR